MACGVQLHGRDDEPAAAVQLQAQFPAWRQGRQFVEPFQNGGRVRGDVLFQQGGGHGCDLALHQFEVDGQFGHGSVEVQNQGLEGKRAGHGRAPARRGPWIPLAVTRRSR